MKKRIRALVLLLALLVSMFGMTGVTASAAISVKTDGYYEIYNVGGRKYLNVYDQTSYNGTNITLWSRDYTPSEYFRFVACSGAYMLVPQHAAGKAVNAYGDYPADGANCCLWDQTYHSSQQFVPEYVSGADAYILRLKYNTNLVLTAAGGSDGSNVYFTRYNGSSYQHWTSSALSGSGSVSTVGGSSVYNASAALSYAAGHWNDGKGLCAEFVSDCIRAGGLTSWGIECTNLFNQLNNEVVKTGYATVQELTLPGGGNSYISASANSGKVSPGDIVFWYCGTCNAYPYLDSVGGPHQHVALISDVSSSYLKVYQHNGAMNNTAFIRGYCYECETLYSKLQVIHFNKAAAPVPCSMSFSPASVTVSPGEKKAVSVKFAGDGIYTLGYSVANTDICSAAWNGDVDYSKGASTITVTGKKPGSTQVTIKLLDRNSNTLYSKAFTVTVSNYSVKISASPASVSLNLASASSQVVTATLSGSYPSDAKLGADLSGVAKGEWVSDAVRDSKAQLKVYAEEEGAGAVTFKLTSGSTTLATATVNLTATAPTYTIAYNANGGTGAPAQQTKKYNKALTLSTTVPKRDGYTFKGWGTSAGAATASYQPGGSYTTNGSLSLYAVWEKVNSITLSFNTGTGTVIPAQTRAGSGSSQTFVIPGTKPVREGYTFLGWSTDPSAEIPDYLPSDSIEITKDVVLYAIWQEETPESGVYRLNYYYYAGSPANGYEEKESEEPSCLFVVRSAEASRDGYRFKGWAWNKSAANPEYQPGDIVEIEESSTLYAVWQATDANSRFRDVKPGQYYYEAVDWAVQNNITSGTSSTSFSPEASCTRAQAVTFLWRAAGCPEPVASLNPFTDVKPADYFYKAVLWAVENGITSGTSQTTFSPAEKCSRAQIVTFLWRFAGSPSENGSARFADVGPASYYADAVAWAVGSGVTSGTGSNRFSPEASCVRGQIVTFLYRFYAD